MTTSPGTQLQPPDEESWRHALEVAREWRSAKLRDVTLTDEQLKELLRAAPKAADGRFELNLHCYGVHFTDRLWFGNTRLAMLCSGCVFEDEVQLSGEFHNSLWEDVTFRRAALFTGAQFTGETNFRKVRFEGGADFCRASFEADARFHGVSFRRSTRFQDAVFGGPAHFAPLVGDRFESGPSDDLDSDHMFTLKQVGVVLPTEADAIDFTGAAFEARATFELAVADEASFQGVEFAGTSMRMRAGRLTLGGARFTGDAVLVLPAGQITLHDVRFQAGALIRFSGELVTDGATFAVDSTLAGPPAGTETTARLRSLRGSSLENLTIRDADLSGCLLAHAYKLDQARIEPTCTFAAPPDQWQFTHRRTIAEENLWRASRPPRPLRATTAWSHPGFDEWLSARVPPPEVLHPSEIAAAYRALRKAIEERKDEPGAADFYYGEMEMRRHAAPAWRGEWLLLGLFWALSGYALRATRALIALAVLCLLFAAAFQAAGFVRPHTFGDTLIYSVGSSARISTGFDNDRLTSTGQVLHIALGILGPVLYGLALLSLRGRVKR